MPLESIGTVEHATAKQFQVLACSEQFLCQVYRQTARIYPKKVVVVFVCFFQACPQSQCCDS